MKITLHCPTFIEIANTVTKGLITKDPQAQTSFSIITENGVNKLQIQTRSQSTFFQGKLNIENIELEDGESTEQTWGVHGGQLKTIISILPKLDTTVTFTLSSSKNVFEVEMGENKFKLPVYDTPLFVFNDEVKQVASISSVDFNAHINNLIKICSTAVVVENHPVSCLHLFLENDTITFMAIDTNTLVEVKDKIVDFEDEKLTVLLKPAQATLLQTQANANDVTKLVDCKNMFGIIDKNNVLCLVSKADMSPLAYSSFIDNTSTEQLITLNKDSFKYAIDSLSKLAPTGIMIDIETEEDKFILNNDNRDLMSVPFKGEIESEQKITLPIMNISNVFNLMSENFHLSWAKEYDKGRLLLVKNLNEKEEEDTNTTIIILTNDKK